MAYRGTHHLRGKPRRLKQILQSIFKHYLTQIWIAVILLWLICRSVIQLHFITSYPQCNLNLYLPSFPDLQREGALKSVWLLNKFDTHVHFDPFALIKCEKKQETLDSLYTVNIPDLYPAIHHALLGLYTVYIMFYGVEPVVALPTVHHRHCWRVHPFYLGRGGGCRGKSTGLLSHHMSIVAKPFPWGQLGPFSLL